MKSSLLTICFFSFLCSSAFAGFDMECEYRFDANKPMTKLFFALPTEIKFGKLIPLQIKPFGGSISSMNTVVLKDYPYVMLADVYRMESEESKVVLMKISPDKTIIEIAFVKMGENSNVKFYKGKCLTRKDSK